MDFCGYCEKTEPEVPLCLFTITMMDGREWDEIACPNCANRVHRSGDVFEVVLQGNLSGMRNSLKPTIKD